MGGLGKYIVPDNKVQIILEADAKNFRGGITEAQQAVQQASQAITQSFERMSESVQSSSNRAAASISGRSGIRQGLRDTEDQMRGTEVAARALSRAMAAVISAAFAKSVFDYGRSLEGLEISFKAITGSAEQAKRELGFVRYEADRLGQVYFDLAEAYKGIMAAGQGTILQGQAIRDIFSAVAESGAVLQLKAEDVRGTLWALSQIISKGKVEAEELRQQLGDRMPYAIQVMAQALGVGTRELEEMMKRGELTIDVLINFAKTLHERNAGSVGEAANSMSGTLNKATTAWGDLKQSLYDTASALGLSSIMNGLATVFRSVSMAIEVATTILKQFWEYAKAGFETLGALASGYGERIGGLVSAVHKLGTTDIWDVKGAKEALGEIGQALDGMKVAHSESLGEITAIWDRADARTNELVSRLNERLREISGASIEAGPPPAMEGFHGPPAPKSITDPQKYVDELKDNIQAQQDAQIADGKLKKESAAQEVAFWQEQLKTAAQGTEGYRLILHELAQAKERLHREEEASRRSGAAAGRKAAAEARKDARDQYQADMAEMRLSLEEYRNNGERRIAIARQMADRVAAIYGTESRQYKEMRRIIEQEERKHQEEMNRLEEVEIGRRRDNAAGEVDLQIADLNARRQLGQITAQQELQALLQLEDRKFQIEMQSLRERLQLKGLEVIEQARIYAEMEQLELRHRLRLQQVNTQIRVEGQSTWRAIGNTMTQTVGSALRGLASGTQSAMDVVRNAVGSVFDMLINLAIQWVQTWIAGLVAGQTAEKAAGATSAVVGAVKAGESVAAIPGWGWAAVAAVVAGTLGILMGTLASAESGYDIPRGVSPLLKAHPEEMVLPAHLANRVRAMTEPDGGRVINNWTVKAMDSRDVKRFLKRHGSALAGGVKAAHRDYRFRGAPA